MFFNAYGDSSQRLYGSGPSDGADYRPVGDSFSTSLGMIALNVPVAIFCYRHIGKKFVIFSMIQVFWPASF